MPTSSILPTLLAQPGFIGRLEAQVIDHAKRQHASLHGGGSICEYEILGAFTFGAATGQAARWCVPFAVEGETEVIFPSDHQDEDGDEETGEDQAVGDGDDYQERVQSRCEGYVEVAFPGHLSGDEGGGAVAAGVEVVVTVESMGA